MILRSQATLGAVGWPDMDDADRATMTALLARLPNALDARHLADAASAEFKAKW